MASYVQKLRGWSGFEAFFGFHLDDICWQTLPPYICCHVLHPQQKECWKYSALPHHAAYAKCCVEPVHFGRALGHIYEIQNFDNLRVLRTEAYAFPERMFMEAGLTSALPDDLTAFKLEMAYSWNLLSGTGFNPNSCAMSQPVIRTSARDWFWPAYIQLLLHDGMKPNNGIVGHCEYAFCPLKWPLAIYVGAMKTASRSLVKWMCYLESSARSNTSLGVLYDELADSWLFAGDDALVADVLIPRLMKDIGLNGLDATGIARRMAYDLADMQRDYSGTKTLKQLSPGATRISQPIQVPPFWAPSCCRYGVGRLRLVLVRNPARRLRALLLHSAGESLQAGHFVWALEKLNQSGVLVTQEMLIRQRLEVPMDVRSQASLYSIHKALLIHLEILSADLQHAMKCLCIAFGACNRELPPFPHLNRAAQRFDEDRWQELWRSVPTTEYETLGGRSELTFLGYSDDLSEEAPRETLRLCGRRPTRKHGKEVGM